LKKENFLSNKENKSNFITLLMETFEVNGIETKQAVHDANIALHCDQT